MTLPQNVADRVQSLSDRKLDAWQEMAAAWLPGSTAPINADAFLSLIVEVKHQRAHLMSQESEIDRLNAECKQRLRQAMENGCAANLAESRLAAANALLRKLLNSGEWSNGALEFNDYNGSELADEIEAHLQGAGDEA